MIEEISRMLDKVRSTHPLVHNITNVVVTNFTANGLYALDASPVMAYSKMEVADMAKIAGALVLNIGTLDEHVVEAMILAGKSANVHGVPVIFDPVGAGATPYRTEAARKIVKEVHVSMIRGNAAEVANVIGEEWQIKGVDAGDTDGDPLSLAKLAAETLKTNITITGKEDIVTDGHETYVVYNGHPLLTKVTGTGCLLTSVIGAFSAVEKNSLKAALAAVVTYGVAAEIAYKTAGGRGPGSFQIEFLNQLSKMSLRGLKEMSRFERI